MGRSGPVAQQHTGYSGYGQGQHVPVGGKI